MAQTQRPHTPGLWRFDNDPSSFSYGDVVSDVPGETRSTIIAQMKWRDGEANADFIVRACNAHDELRGQVTFLVDRLREFEGQLTGVAAREFYGHVAPAIARIEATIAKAEGR